MDETYVVAKPLRRFSSACKLISCEGVQSYVTVTQPPVRKLSASMQRCILKNDMEGLKLLLSNCKRDCINDYDHFGRTPFHVALQLANPRALYLLLYYPLIHPSKIFATLDWTDILDALAGNNAPDGVFNPHSYKSMGDACTEIDQEYEYGNESDTNAQLSQHEEEGNDNTGVNQTQSCFKIGNLLLNHWKTNPEAYTRSIFSVEGDAAIYGCGLKHVEELYEEHYKYLIGKEHYLERIAREYTAKYSKLYIRHPCNVHLINIVPNAKSKGKVNGTDGEAVNSKKKSESINENTHSTIPTKHSLLKSQLPLETVDVMATFDKTAPLHLLFSNINIPSYRDNIMACFQILLHYFGQATRAFSTILQTEFAYSQLQRPLSVVTTDASTATLVEGSFALNNQPLDMSDAGMSPKQPKRVRFDMGDGQEPEELSWVNSTLCNPHDESNDLYENRKKQMIVGLYDCNKDDVDPESGLHMLKTSQLLGPRSININTDPKAAALHATILESVNWLRPNVSWEAFMSPRDFSRSTILHKLSSSRDLCLIRLALVCGFSPLSVNESGSLPVHISVDVKDVECFLELLHVTFEALFKQHLIRLRQEYMVDNARTFKDPLSDPQELKLQFDKFMNRISPVDSFDEESNETYTSVFFYPKITNPSNDLILELVLLTEQLVYRCIKSQSWKCLKALLNYNDGISCRLLKSQIYMHKFLTFSNAMGCMTDFMRIVNLNRNRWGTFDVSNLDMNLNSNEPGPKQKPQCYSGYGIPNGPLKKSATTLSKPIVIKTPTDELEISSPIRNIIYASPKREGGMRKTWIITHPTCLHHLALPEPTDAPNKRHRLVVTYPENPTRLEVIISNNNGILRSDILENVKLLHSPPPASLADVLRVHDWGYVNKLLNQVQVAQRRWVANSYWPILADGDTPVTPHSWSAALYAAGSVIAAVDAVCTGACKNAFCAVRPPGHHLGTWGGAHSPTFEDEDFAAGSQGFCLINNVAIGAAYAKYTYAPRGIRRVAIIDFDVHHGNGTEQIIRNIGPKPIKCAARSPSNGLQHNVYTTWMGWRDANDKEEVFFASIHAYDGVFYPGTGKPCVQYDNPTQPRIINVALPQGTSSEEFKYEFETKICPYLFHFEPDLIFISAGFDGHYRDSVSFGFTRYTERDFFHITQQIVTIANSVCDGRVVSVLEGGYNTRLDTQSPFARCVFEHAAALASTSPDYKYPFMYGQDTIEFLLAPVAAAEPQTESTTHSDDPIVKKEMQCTSMLSALDHHISSTDKTRANQLYYNMNVHSNILYFEGNCWFNWFSRHFMKLYYPHFSHSHLVNQDLAIEEDILQSHHQSLRQRMRHLAREKRWLYKVRLGVVDAQIRVLEALGQYMHKNKEFSY
ncbi:bifunctional Ureohydrolase domain superfamily/Histone deacetylase domain superfamily/Histone deacetylase domain/Ankyrin repeat-containing domain superfamily [Babesia duncani]|uniref:Bifunctional Ureohydrolase domain superfamily/Histone deacetylase domain superfamily/Histone deacetylase domain/Ankyrin repeat-containing domain superfamily n=1 Tax=Babesia duncani TaxID=323732 RepID=A0AAD9PJS4_9APIC|nr:bifunctional Ureohydrolase domain superfamily/Histone deacetylase domain superfamily/Histone deacetylase domain/Ankyrin repeat-containing domain superfamily [Babesia duncani]